MTCLLVWTDKHLLIWFAVCPCIQKGRPPLWSRLWERYNTLEDCWNGHPGGESSEDRCNGEKILRYGKRAFEKIYRNLEEYEVSLHYSENVELIPLPETSESCWEWGGEKQQKHVRFWAGFFFFLFKFVENKQTQYSHWYHMIKVKIIWFSRYRFSPKITINFSCF